ncbi:MAG: hypothetical protein JWN67_2287 [Actinomycetia bacterium]|nr:hypothetical protein [Actinomycetes bacterium]
MSIDERRLSELVVESQDLQVDAMEDVKASLPQLEELRHERRNQEIDPTEIARFIGQRRSMIKRLGLGGGGILAVTGLGSILTDLFTASPAGADEAVDVQILQTASSLEALAVATYGAALTLPFIKDGNKVVVAFAQETMKQHDEHKKAFQAQTKALGGEAQDTPNPKYAPIVEQAKPTLKTPADVVKLAATLEQVARDTYLADLSLLTDEKTKAVIASVMGVETQHLATLRAVSALLGAAPEAIAIPVDPNKLPKVAGSVAFPQDIPTPEMASPPEEGAVK